jgi:hypothetical protein
MVGRVWLISNVYGDLNVEDSLIRDIISWRFDPATEKEFEKLGFPKDTVQVPLFGSRHQKYKITSPEGLEMQYTKMVAKGCSVRNHFYTIMKNYQLKDTDLVIYFDGDKQIDYNDALKIAEKLKTNDFVLSRRENISGISDDRFLVEKFENSFIEDHFSIELPDIQCGCWGLTGKHLKRIYKSLNAEGFEIELDLTACSLEAGIRPEYIDIKVRSPSATTFKSSEDHLTKLVFLMNKFKINQTQLIEKSQVFARKNKQLPMDYTKYFSYSQVNNLTF